MGWFRVGSVAVRLEFGRERGGRGMGVTGAARMDGRMYEEYGLTS